jgi:hypothetical protein
MIISIIIGFQYESHPTIDTIPGLIIDLFRAFEYSQSVLKSDKIFFITDITQSPSIDDVLSSIIDGSLSSDIISFYEKITSSNVSIYNCFHLQQLLKSIEKIKQNYIDNTKIIVYFSGHGWKSFGLLPSGEPFEFNWLLPSISSYTCIFLLDCCEAKPKHYNYIYTLDNSSTSFCKSDIINHQSSNNSIIYITPLIEYPVSNKNGSPFSKLIFNSLTKKNLLWKNLKPCYIYSSHIINTQIPYWLFGLSSNVDNVTINPHFIKISFL